MGKNTAGEQALSFIRKILLAISITMIMLVLGLVMASENSYLFSHAVSMADIPDASAEFIDTVVSGTKASGAGLVNADEIFPGYDRPSDLYYIPDAEIAVSFSRGTDLYHHYDESGQVHTLLAVKDETHSVYRFIETGLPVMDIRTIIENRDRRRKRARVYVHDSGNESEEYMLEYNIRGGTSRAYPKKSYSLHNTLGLPMSMLGLPQNGKYVINSMYEDEYKVRDVLSWDIYSQFTNALTEAATEPAMVYIEVFIDDVYQGLYGLQEYNNEDKFGLTDRSGRIYEVDDYVFPGTASDMPSGGSWDGLSLKYNNMEYDTRWDPMIQLVDLLQMEDSDSFTARADALLDIESFLNYYLFVEVLQARDNVWKNMYFTHTRDGAIQVQPWDLDMTFGSFMDQTDYALNHVLVLLEHNYTFPLHQLLRHYEGFGAAAAVRYFELRGSIISDENLLSTYRGYHDLLRTTGALERDSQRWPDAPRIPAGREYFIEEFIVEHMKILDEHFARLQADGHG